jgi:hypothetical protein
MPTTNIRRKRLYHQMAITIIDGCLMGRVAHVEHPICMVDGIHTMSPDPDGNCMGHRED